MPLNSTQSTPQLSGTPSATSIISSIPIETPSLDLEGFGASITNAAETVPTGTFLVVITTGMTTGDLTLKYNGEYDVTNSSVPRFSLDGTQNGQPLTIIQVGDKLYTKAGTGKYGLAASSDSAASIGLANVRPDLPTIAKLIGDSVRGVTKIGPSAVDGVVVDHWQVLVDSDLFTAGTTGTATVDLWLDSSALIRRVSYNLANTVLGTSTIVTLNYGDFNSAVSIKEPSPSEVR